MIKYRVNFSKDGRESQCKWVGGLQTDREWQKNWQPDGSEALSPPSGFIDRVFIITREKGKRSDAAEWLTPLDDRQCMGQKRYKNYNTTITDRLRKVN